MLSPSGELLGSASLLLEDFPGYDHYAPWLASVYLIPSARGCGLGRLLIEKTVAHAQKIGHTKLSLFTPEHEHYYAKMGWQLRERVVGSAGKALAIMERTLAVP